MSRSAQDFQRQAKSLSLTEWLINRCSICGYRCGFHWNNGTGSILYDPGCRCHWGDWKIRSWKEIAEHYNMQSDLTIIREMNQYWKFQEE